MSASTLLPLLDIIAPPGSGEAGVSADASEKPSALAAALVQWSLDEYRHIRDVDDLPIHPKDPAVRRMVELMRQVYEEWAIGAEAVLDRVAAMKTGVRIKGVGELGDAVGRTRAKLSVTLEDLDRAEEQFRNGQTVSLEEVRRDLRELRAASGR